MPWVIKQPKRSDFCGCPPCGLCYRWRPEGGKAMDGVLHMALELLGREPTAKELALVQQGAEAVHAAHLRAKVDPYHDRPDGATFDTATVDVGLGHTEHVRLWFKQQPVRRKAEPKRSRYPTVDHAMAAKAAELERKKEVVAAMRAEKKRMKMLAKMWATVQKEASGD